MQKSIFSLSYMLFFDTVHCGAMQHIIFYFREVVELILGRGFDINVRTARGTALHEAAVCGKKDVVKYLLESNVNLELRDRDDKTVLEVMDDLNTPMTREVIHLVLGKINRKFVLFQFI